MPADKDIAEHLEDQSHGTVGTNMFVGWMPDSPDICISVTQTGGSAPEPTVDLEYPNVQIRVRHTDAATGWTLINDIYDDLHGVANQTIEGRVYSIQALAPPGRLGPDAKGRWLYVCNFMTYKAIE